MTSADWDGSLAEYGRETVRQDVAGAIERLPDLPLDGSLPGERQNEAATGTNGECAPPKDWP